MTLLRSVVLFCVLLGPLLSHAAVLTAEKLLTAPRPGTGIANPSGTKALVGVETFSFEEDKFSQILYQLSLPSSEKEISTYDSEPNSQLKSISTNSSSGFWLSDTTAAYIDTSSNTLLARDLTGKDGDWIAIGSFPAPVDTIQVSRQKDGTASTLVFSAQVYADGNLTAVPEHDESQAVKTWDRVKVYDSLFVRHWDTWIYPGKRSQLFAIDLTKEDSKWSFSGKIRNLLNGTALEAPVPPFGDEVDYSVSATHVAFTSKDPDLNPAWHTKQNIYIVPLSGDAAPSKLTKGDHGATSSPTFSHDGSKVAWLQMSRDGFESDRRRMYLTEMDGKSEATVLLKDWQLSPNGVTFSADDTALIGIVEDAEQSVVFEVNIEEGLLAQEPKKVTGYGGVGNVQVLDHGLLVTASSLQGPSDLYLLSPHAKKQEELRASAIRLTNFGQQEGSSLVEVDMGPLPEQFHFPGHKGRRAHGWIHYPPGYSKEKTYALAVLIHGGPEGAWTNSWSTRWNPAAFAAEDLFVITIDPAGSTGFGQAYQEEILHNWGGAPYEDIRAGTRHILKRFANIDSDRVVAAGASYGGYMINWLQGHNEDKLFKGLVCHDGVFSTLSVFYSTEELYFPESEFGGTPWESRQIYDKWSPEHHTHKWETPQLTVAGGLDFRLPTSEGISVFNTLQRRGVPSRLVHFDQENHWVREPKNSLIWHREVLGWLKKYSAAQESTTSRVSSYVGEPLSNGSAGSLVFQT